MGSLSDRAWFTARAKAALQSLGTLAFAAGVGLAAGRATRPAVALALAPLLVTLFIARPRTLAIIAVGAIPLAADVAGGAGGGVHVAPSDLALTLAGAAAALRLLLDKQSRSRLGRLRTLWIPLGLYAGAMLVIFAAHPQSSSLVNSLQRVELTALPVFLAAVALTREDLLLGTKFFVLASLVLGLSFAVAQVTGGTSVLGVDKNPAGQFMASAILLVLALPSYSRRWRVLCLPPLALGLVSTQSRGALYALAVSLLLLVLLQQGASRLRIVAAALGAVAIVGLALTFLPSDARSRTFATSSTQDYALNVRKIYREDALKVYEAHRLTGVGVGNYQAGDPDNGTQTTDPHNVFLLQLAEGGPLLVVAFGILSVVPVVTMVRRRDEPLAAVAAAVQVGILTHAQIDVYWVRSTPALGWLLLGAALTFKGNRA